MLKFGFVEILMIKAAFLGLIIIKINAMKKLILTTIAILSFSCSAFANNQMLKLVLNIKTGPHNSMKMEKHFDDPEELINFNINDFIKALEVKGNPILNIEYHIIEPTTQKDEEGQEIWISKKEIAKFDCTHQQYNTTFKQLITDTLSQFFKQNPYVHTKTANH